MANTFFNTKQIVMRKKEIIKGRALQCFRNFSLDDFSCHPSFIGLAFGEQVVNAINDWIPIWVMNGLKAAGAILPAMGIAILMRYLPIKTYWPYFIIGFVLLAYGAQFFSVLGVALVGLALAAIYVMNHNKGGAATTSGTVIYEDDEEVEIDD